MSSIAEKIWLHLESNLCFPCEIPVGMPWLICFFLLFVFSLPYFHALILSPIGNETEIREYIYTMIP